jgi:uroporphyrinogen-III synthase
MRVLITRPRPDADELAERLHALGHATIIEPLIDIVFADGPNLELSGAQALLLTSANGARAAARRTRERTLRVVAVGPATAAEARAQGFTTIAESAGDGVEGLAEAVRATLKPAAGSLIHVTGSVTAGDLSAALKPQGYSVRVERLYEAHAAQNLSGALMAELTAGVIDVATFFSPRTAALFAGLIAATNLEHTCATMSAATLSDAVAKALSPLRFRKVLVADRPITVALIEALKSA